MKKIIIILLVIISIAKQSFAQNGFTNKDEAKNITDASGLKQGKWIYDYNKSSKYITLGNHAYYTLVVYKDGKENEVSRIYYNNGKLYVEIPWIDGKKNGINKMYYENGQLKEEAPYIDDKMNGVVKDYDDSGKLKVEVPMTNGKMNGVMKEYYASGQLKSETPYTDDKQDGEVKTYEDNTAVSSASTSENAKTEEPVYRGGGDALKGLNVSKPKEIVSGNYYALIIGIDKYAGTWHPLNTAVHDAQALENTLRTKYRIDKFYTLYDAQATRSAIENVLEKLVNTLTENDNVVIYYSGHGDFKKTMNKGYWVPVDAKTEAASDLISNSDIETFLASIKTKHTLLIADACFSGDILRGNTLTEPFEESDKYYSKVYNLPSRQALTSGGNEPVMDGGKDGHSVFAYYLLKYLTNNTNKYFDAGSLYNNIKIPVVNNSNQTPHLEPIPRTGDEGGQFIFIKK
jgi:antitoxin component YwqK of YwqJK toxin-antitoxin module